MKVFTKKVTNVILCNTVNSASKEDHHLRQSDYIYAPRVAWGVDLIPNMPLSNENRKVALLAVDLFKKLHYQSGKILKVVDKDLSYAQLHKKVN